MEDRQFVFAPFRLDLANQQLWRGDDLIPLRPKLFDVLHHLLEQAGRLVTREELRAAGWSGTTVSDSVLRGAIRELRDILQDDAAAAGFIETIPHRGYRFIAPVTRTARGASRVAGQAGRDGAIPHRDAPLIGRDADLARLHAWLDSAVDGTRQIVFVSGEPGIGKTTLVDAFLASAADGGDVRTVRGQCVEHYGSGEAYLPVLEALGQLCRPPDGAPAIALLGRYAPTWLAQMPGLVADAELDAVQRRAQGATRERMLRELTEALEALTADQTVVLALEDLHWSDYSTIDLISVLAQRRTPARLMVVATYRPADVTASGHPLKGMTQELRVHAQCEELPLSFLSDVEVGEYLSARFPGQQLPAELGQIIHRSTEGNPLFVVNVVDYWLGQRVLVETEGRWHLAATVADLGAVPDNLRLMIDKQLGRLAPEDARLLEVASVAGGEFSTAVVASALEERAEQVEDACERLARREQFLVARATDRLVDGTVAGRYAFRHALYQQVLYERIAPARRARLHRRIGDWEEHTLSARVKDRAAQLAMHFERGQDHARAIAYLTQAADNAMRRQGPHEAVDLLGRSLSLLPHLPDGPERAQHELALLVTIGVPLLMTRGYASADVERTYARARELCAAVGESPQHLPALAGLYRFHFVRAEFGTARAIGEQILRLAERTNDPLIFLVAHSLLGVLLLSLGELASARLHLQKGIALYDPVQHRFMASVYGDDPGVTCHSFAAMCHWLLGYPDQGLAHIESALRIAAQMESPYSETFARDFATWLHVLRRDEQAARAYVDALTPVAAQHGFQFLLADSQVLNGWILAALGSDAEGLRQAQSGIAAYQATGAAMSRPAHLSLLARVHAQRGEAADGLAALAEALTLVDQTGEQTHEAELYRLRGELLLIASPPATA
jgi:DNA-binding winged helix-turn-helix (wHTH) protein/predicted ATPase